MSGLASLQLRQLSRAARFLPCSPVASGSSLAPAGIPLSLVRQLSVSAALSAKGQGGREVKVKKTPKGRENVGKGGKGKNKAAEEEEEEEDDDSSGGGRKAPRRTNEPNESDVIDAEVAKADDKMSKSVDWLAEKFAESVARVRGQVSPAVLDPIRVVVSKDEGEVPVSQLGAVSVKGNSLVIDVFDAEHTKAVEGAIHKANLRGMSPNRVNARQIRIVIGKPSEKDRLDLVKSLTTLSDQAKTRVRTARGAGLKVTGKDGTADLQAITEKYTKQIDDKLKKAKAELSD